MAAYTVTIRDGPKVTKERFPDLDSALAEIERRGRELEGEVDLKPVDLKIGRSFDPVKQVAARIELKGPGRRRGGIDIRGDGSAEGYTGRLRRSLVEQADGESPYDALRRAFSS